MNTPELHKELPILLSRIGELQNNVTTRLKKEEGFNVMSLLRKPTDERRLHSRFIAAVLDPKAPHGMGDTFLALFLKRIGSSFSCATNSLKITPDYDNHSEEENIDILIENQETGRSIIIENKIYALDQQGQLMRYFAERLKRLREARFCGNMDEAFKKIEVFYLTLNGRYPDAISYILSENQKEKVIPSKISESEYDELRNGKLEKHIRTITYGNTISDWIKDCLSVCKDDSFKIQLKNYNAIIMELANTQETIEERKELVQILGNGNKWEAANYLLRNLNHVCWHVVNDFFIELFQELKLNAVLDKTELTRIDNFAHKGRNKGVLYFERNTPVGILKIAYNDYGNLQVSISTKITEDKPLELTSEHYFEDENLLHLTSLQYRQDEIKRIARIIQKDIEIR